MTLKLPGIFVWRGIGKRYIIDTNALISFVTDRNPEQQQRVAPLFESAAHLNQNIPRSSAARTTFLDIVILLCGRIGG